MIAAISPDTEQFRTDALRGLRRAQKCLPPKYFYDAAGAKLFEQITELDEYYPTRTEMGIMRRSAGEMAARCGAGCSLIEFGAGNLSKVRHLLDRLERPAGYVPVDVSEEQLHAAAAELALDYPDLDVLPVAVDFTADFVLPAIRCHRRVVYFPGSTLGNFDPPEAERLLRRIARLVGPGGGLLLGIDLRKNSTILEAAYNDHAGVTAAFNLNLLHRMNSELGATFDADSFRHRAYYNASRSRIEMHLESLRTQRVRIAGETFTFRTGETIHTENSYKYDIDELTAAAQHCGLRADAHWTDDRTSFAVIAFTAATLR